MFEGVGSAMVHRKFQQWAKAGVYRNIWRRDLAEYDALEGVAWLWEAADGSNIEAPLAQESNGPNPTDRGKKRRKATFAGRENGVHLSLVVTGANRHDSIALDPLLKARIVGQREDTVPLP